MALMVKDKAFYKHTLRIAIPIILQGMITIGVNMMDTIMIGKIGETELSAVFLAGAEDAQRLLNNLRSGIIICDVKGGDDGIGN